MTAHTWEENYTTTYKEIIVSEELHKISPKEFVRNLKIRTKKCTNCGATSVSYSDDTEIYFCSFPDCESYESYEASTTS